MSLGSETLPNMEPRITTPTLNVNSECFQPKQTVEWFENGGEFVGHSKGHSTMLLSTAVAFCKNSLPLSSACPTGLRESKLTTVIYGTKSAPYLATRSLKQLAIDDGDKYPLAAEVIMSDVYMDDLLTGANGLESGRKLQVQLVSILKGSRMELHKWSASNPLLLPDSMCQAKDLSYCSSTETKTLGLLWKPHPDSFAFKISSMNSNCDNLIVTKKSVISTIARMFDPLGLIGPVITRAKILLQSLWQLKLDWNDPLPSNLVSYWKTFIDALEYINCLDIPSYCLQNKSIRTELHGFSDSSEKAYGAALYLRCINTSGQISV
ncbi:integrase catalytic domain-containing protein, partial [Trichonephila clavipes]